MSGLSAVDQVAVRYVARKHNDLSGLTFVVGTSVQNCHIST